MIFRRSAAASIREKIHPREYRRGLVHDARSHVRYGRVLHYRRGPKLRGRTHTLRTHTHTHTRVCYLDVLRPDTYTSRMRARCCARARAQAHRPAPIRAPYNVTTWIRAYTFVPTSGRGTERRRVATETAERRGAGCRVSRQMRPRVSIASVPKWSWSVICVRAGPGSLAPPLLYLSLYLSLPPSPSSLFLSIYLSPFYAITSSLFPFTSLRYALAGLSETSPSVRERTADIVSLRPVAQSAREIGYPRPPPPGSSSVLSRDVRNTHGNTPQCHSVEEFLTSG